MTAPCKRETCQKEWAEYFDPEAKKGDRFTHCSSEGCHTQYFEQKNGGWCERCKRNACEGCMDYGEHYYALDIWYCPACVADDPDCKKRLVKQWGKDIY